MAVGNVSKKTFGIFSLIVGSVMIIVLIVNIDKLFIASVESGVSLYELFTKGAARDSQIALVRNTIITLTLLLPFLGILFAMGGSVLLGWKRRRKHFGVISTVIGVLCLFAYGSRASNPMRHMAYNGTIGNLNSGAQIGASIGIILLIIGVLLLIRQSKIDTKDNKDVLIIEQSKARPEIYGLCYWSLFLSFIPFVGFIISLFALQKIAKSNGMLRGKGIAYSGIVVNFLAVVSLIMTLLQK